MVFTLLLSQQRRTKMFTVTAMTMNKTMRKDTEMQYNMTAIKKMTAINRRQTPLQTKDEGTD